MGKSPKTRGAHRLAPVRKHDAPSSSRRAYDQNVLGPCS